MKFKKLWHYCVVIAGLIVKVNLSGLCSSDSDCTAANTACISGLCNCVQGFTTQNGKCSKVLGRTCLDYADCDDGRTICVETGRCQCQENEWHELNGMCVSYYGHPCKTWLDCGNGYKYDCIDNVCRCQSGYRFKNTTCEKIIGSLCLLNASKTECPLEHNSCKHWGWWIDTLHGMCVCDVGYSEKDGLCIQGSRCEDVPCGYTLHHSYRYLKWDSSEAERWNTEYAFSHLQVSCNIDNVCTCARGFVSVGASCLPVLGRNCVNQNDCGNYPGYVCNNQTSECDCAPGFYSREERWDYTEEENRKHDEEYYYHHSVNMPSRNIHLCLPVIGQSCFDVSCLNAVANAFCNVNQKCVCTKGYVETNTGSCEKVLGMTCLQDSFCQIVEGGTCGNDYTCKCKDGYIRNGHVCFYVLGSTCNSNSDCQLSNSECKEGSCACVSGYTSFDFRCLRNQCAIYVPLLPDLYRRAVNYRSLTNEPVIDDALLVERWYSIGKHSLLVSETAPDPGNCSTFYPIYLKENLSASQLAMMETNEVSLSLEIRTLNVYNHSEFVNIKVRKCGTETQIYVRPPKTRFAGFCTSYIRLKRLKRSNGLQALVVPDLLFEPVHIGNRRKNKPFLVFSCLPSEMSGTTMSRYPHESFQKEDDIYFYSVHWHIDGIHFQSFGPVRKRTLVNDTSIFEKDILSAGYKLGFQIRCSFEITEDPNSLKGLLALSEYFITGFTENEMSLYEYEGSSFRQITSYTPLGCESFEDDDNAYCELNWALVDDFAETHCNISHTAHGIPKTCSFSIRGLTSLGSKQMSTSWRDRGQIMSVHKNIKNETHYIDIKEWLGTKVDITGDLKYTEYKIKFSPATNTTGHQLWNNYQIPDITVHLGNSWLWDDSCSINPLKYPVISKSYYASLLDSVSVDSAGEYLLYRSKHKPVEIQLETEYCKEGRVCICGITYRNGIEIYTINYCYGLKRQSQVYGVKKTPYPNYVTLIDGTSVSIYARAGIIMNIYVWQKHSNKTEGEGLCLFSDKSYRLRDGRIQTTNNGFLSSWRVPVEESLLNPKNHKSFSWTDTYSQCYCSENTTGREVTHHRNYTYPTYSGNGLNITYMDEQANVFFHHFKCSSENLCHMNHVGEEWPESLMPSYVLDSVTARMTITNKGTVPLLHLFCNFDQRNGFRYKIIWKLDGDSIFQSKVMTFEETEQFYITNDDFKSEKFLLEAEFSCGVSVHDDTGALLLDTVYSEEIAAIEIVKTEVLLPRGGEVTLQLKLNVRLICEKSSSCYFDFQLFDPEDSNNCSDSSVAFKSKYTCGQRVIGIDLASSTSNQQSVVNITLTTKNDYMYVLRDTFSLKMKLVSSDANSKLWDHTFSKTINIFVRDDDRYWQRNYCFSTNDPRVRTFDGQYYNNMLVGEFVMMKHKTLPVEVQVETFNCGSWRVACTCGVTVRAGRDVFTINHCHGEHITGYLLADDRILKVKRRNEHRYQIYLPHGTQVDVWIISWASYVVNVYIYPSPKDMKEVEGLCGNFDGSIWGDLIHSDGRVTQTLYYYWWWWWSQSDPDEFVKSWGVMSSKSGFQSLTDVDAIEERLESWYKNDMLCVCVGSEGGGAIKCSANEKDTCLSPVEEPGLDVTIAVRQKRSGHLLDKQYKQRMKRLKEKRAVIKDEIHRNIGPRNAEDIDGAVASCNQTLSSSCGILSVKEDGLNVTFEELVYNCGQDRAANPGMNWEALTCEAIEANVEQELKKDIQFQNDNPDIVAAIKETLCVGNCSGHGECSKGTCICFSGYTASDCSIDLKGMVIIEGITGDGICDISQSYCDCIRLTTSGSIETSKYNLVHKEYDFTGGWSVLGTSIGTVVYDNFNEVFVCPEISKRKQRSTNGSTSIADQYVISLSNDGNTFGNVSTVILLDSTCLKVDQGNETYGIHLLSGFCIIGGICYKTNASPTNNVCLKCRDEENVFDWTRIDACGETENVNGKDAISPSIIGVVVGIAGVVVLGVSIAAVCYVKKRLAQRAAVYVGELYEVSPKKIFQTNQLRRNDDTMPEF